MNYPGRWLVIVSVAAWAFCVLLVVVWLEPWGVSDTSCDLAPNASVFGEATRSWLPPGTTCSWDNVANGQAHVDSPSPVRLLVVVFAVVGPFFASYLRRLLRSSADTSLTASV